MRACPFTDRGNTVWSCVNSASSLSRWPDIGTIPGFNDGLLRVKLIERDDPLRHEVADKLKFKTFAHDRLGSNHVVPVTDVIEDNRHLLTCSFPDTCIIKPTDASGVYKIRRNAEILDRNLLSSFFRRNHYEFTREKFYKYITARVILEPLIAGDGLELPLEYKLFCFFGRVKIIQWTRRSDEKA